VQAWIRKEWRRVDLGDPRLEGRLLDLADALSRCPEGTINEACRLPAERQGAYRFLANERVEAEAILKPHLQCSWERGRKESHLQVIQDTSDIDFSTHPATQGLGPLENAHMRGFLVHSALLVSEGGVPLGLVHQERWVRSEEGGLRGARRERPWSEKESYRWQRTMEAVRKGRPRRQRVIVTGDRESDLYGLFSSPREEGLELLVRSAQNRALQEEEGRLHEAMRRGPSAGQLTVEVKRTGKRRARTAVCAVRFRAVLLRPPRHADAGVPKVPVRVWVVAVEEANPPAGEDPVRWVLLATWPITTLEEALACARLYARRWLIERYHYVLKSGCHLEHSQLRTWEGLERLEALFAILAWRLLALTYLAREDPQAPCTRVLSEQDWHVLFAAHYHRLPQEGEPPPGVGEAMLWVAHLGGYWGRKGDAPPGVKVLWRGLRRLEAMREGFQLALSIARPEATCA